MKTTTAPPQTITAAAVVRALAQSLTLAAVYGAQRTAAALRATHRATIAALMYQQKFTDITSAWKKTVYNAIL